MRWIRPCLSVVLLLGLVPVVASGSPVIVEVAAPPSQSAAASSGTPVSGIISSDTTWTVAGSPYVLAGVVQVAYGTTLAIEPGVVVVGSSTTEIQAFGTVRAVGNPEAEVYFNGVRIMSGANTPSQPYLIELRYCVLGGGRLLSPTGNAAYGRLILTDSRVEYPDEYMYLWNPTSDCYIERNIFRGSTGISVGNGDADLYVKNNVFFDSRGTYVVQNWASSDGWMTYVNANTFYPPTAPDGPKYILEVPAGYSNAAMDGTGNYWVGIGDPSVYIHDKNNDLACASVIPFAPTLSAPAAETPYFDQTAPVISVAGVTDGGVYAAPVFPTFSSPDADVELISAELDGAAWSSGGPVGEGAHTLVVSATDTSGNVAQKRVRFTVDLPAPLDGPTFSGTGAQVVGPFYLPGGLTVFQWTQSSPTFDNFIVHLVDSTGATVAYLTNELGYGSSGSLVVDASGSGPLPAGNYYLNVDAGGPWTMSLGKVTTPPTTDLTFSGSGITAVGPFSLPGGLTIFNWTYSSVASTNFIVHLVDSNGVTVGYLTNELGTGGSGSLLVEPFGSGPLPAGVYYLDVYTDGQWTMSLVPPSNTPPVLAPIGNKTVNELALLSFTATATDADGDARTFSLGAGAPSGAVITSGGAFTWTPSEAQGPGSYPITIIVSDGKGGTDSETITVTVNEVADISTPPVLAPIGNKSVNELAPLSFTATATDADGDALTFSLGAGAPAGASITSGGAFSWTPSEGQGPASYPVTVIVSDEHGATDSETITITVDEVSIGPTPTYLSVRFAETTASSYGIPYGASPYLTIQGILVELDNTANRVSGQTVDLWTSFDGSNYTKSSAAVMEDPGNPGLYSVRVLCTRRTWYRLRFGGSEDYERSLGRTLNAGPKAWLTAPVAPSTLSRTRTYSVYGYLKPRHSGSPVKIYAYQKVGGTWMARATFSAQASNYSTYSRYVASIRLPSAGEWRIRAYHRDNAGGVHYASYSSWRYVTVR